MSADSSRGRGAFVRNRLIATLFALGVASSLAARPVSEDDQSPSFRLKWLSDLGAESITAGRDIAHVGKTPFTTVTPGAAYVLALEEDGAPRKLTKLAADSSIPYGAATAAGSTVVAASDGSVSLWSVDLSDGAGTLRWQTELGERVMSVSWDGGDSVFIASRSNRLLALDASDGSEVWSVDIGGKAEGPPVREAESLFVATKRNTLLRLDAATGKVQWKAELPGPALHPPVLAGEEPRLVVCGAWNGHLAAFEAHSGEPRWTIELSDRLAGAPVAGEDFVAAVTTDGTVQAFELAGELRWSAAAAIGAADLVLHPTSGEPGKLLVVSSVLRALDPQTGETLEDYPAGAVKDVNRRFLDAMIEGEKVYTETEKTAILERESFPISGTLFGEARVFGERLVFVTEEGWIYLFDAASLRPLSRYRAGQRSYAPPLLASDALVAASGEELFGIDPDSGRALWRRSLGEVKEVVAAKEALGVIADDRLSVIDPVSGTRRWSARGEFRSVCAAQSSESVWLATAERALRAFSDSGDPVGMPLAMDGTLVSAVSLGAFSWAAATEDGQVARLSWQEGLADASGVLSKSWEIQLEEAVVRMSLAGETLLVESEAGYLAGLSLVDGLENWRLPLAQGEMVQPALSGKSILVWGTESLRAYDTVSGESVIERDLSSPAVGADLREGTLLWLDRSGRAHRATLPDATQPHSTELGVPLEKAHPITDGFLVTTTAGEVGLVELLEPPSLGDIENHGFQLQEDFR